MAPCGRTRNGSTTRRSSTATALRPQINGALNDVVSSNVTNGKYIKILHLLIYIYYNCINLFISF